MTPNEKGKALEAAVAAIEGQIARTFPGFSEQSFRIESRKIVSVKGVSHEIDLWVELDMGSGYRSLFIFECKNWATPVGKNEVIVLAEKIRAVGAQKGFLVAQQLTEDARAQAQNDGRIEFVAAVELSAEAIEDVLGPPLQTVAIEQREMALEFRTRRPSGPRSELVLGEMSASLHGRPLDIDQFLTSWMVAHLGQTTQHLAAILGVHLHHMDAVREYSEGELLVAGHDIAAVHLSAHVNLHVLRPRILSAFDIRTRGRAVVLEPIAMPGGGAISMTFGDLRS